MACFKSHSSYGIQDLIQSGVHEFSFWPSSRNQVPPVVGRDFWRSNSVNDDARSIFVEEIMPALCVDWDLEMCANWINGCKVVFYYSWTVLGPDLNVDVGIRGPVLDSLANFPSKSALTQASRYLRIVEKWASDWEEYVHGAIDDISPARMSFQVLM